MNPKEKKDNKVKKEFIMESLTAVIGKQGEEIIDFLDPEKYVNEFIIAKKLDNTINQTRNILYRLSEHGLVSSTRKKDKRKGWYTYFWKLETLRTLNFLKEMTKKRIEQITHQIQSREVKTFYVCERCNIEYNEENALLHDFTCSECGNVFALKDNTKVIRELKRNLEKHEKQVEAINSEIEEEMEKGDKKKTKEIKKEEKENGKEKRKGYEEEKRGEIGEENFKGNGKEKKDKTREEKNEKTSRKKSKKQKINFLRFLGKRGAIKC